MGFSLTLYILCVLQSKHVAFAYEISMEEGGEWTGKLENGTDIHQLPSAGRFSAGRCAHTISLTPPHGPYKESIIIILNLLVLKKWRNKSDEYMHEWQCYFSLPFYHAKMAYIPEL